MVHIGWSTVEKRIREFAGTANGELTWKEFEDLAKNLEPEHVGVGRSVDSVWTSDFWALTPDPSPACPLPPRHAIAKPFPPPLPHLPLSGEPAACR